MQLLLIKTSSLGDIIHTLPALTDAHKHYPDLQCDWVIEENFAEIPTWHPAVTQVIPVALRRWRRHIWQTWSEGSWQHFIHRLTQKRYDAVIDVQGLLKSAWLTYRARGMRHGFDRHSARESLAALAYQQKHPVARSQHAITRIRQLFAAALHYTIPDTALDYGIRNTFRIQSVASNILVFLHGTTWYTKHWPDDYWLALAQRAIKAGFRIHLPWYTSKEHVRARQIAAIHPHISLVPKGHLQQMAYAMCQAQAVVGVDTGLAHLAAALDIPCVTLYMATEPALTGTQGKQQVHLQANFACAPCLRKHCTYSGISTTQPACCAYLPVETVWHALRDLLAK